MILVTGGAGFIGANFVLEWLAQRDEAVINLDKLTYAGNLHNLESLQGDARPTVVQDDVGDRALRRRPALRPVGRRRQNLAFSGAHLRSRRTAAYGKKKKKRAGLY